MTSSCAEQRIYVELTWNSFPKNYFTAKYHSNRVFRLEIKRVDLDQKSKKHHICSTFDRQAEGNETPTRNWEKLEKLHIFPFAAVAGQEIFGFHGNQKLCNEMYQVRRGTFIYSRFTKGNPIIHCSLRLPAVLIENSALLIIMSTWFFIRHNLF